MTYKILLADDESNILDVCMRYLVREGYQVCTAKDGNEAMDVWRKEQPDLMVLDVMMPGRDGWSVAEEIHNQCDMPILFLTALGQEKDRLYGLTMGADDYLTKPFSPRELVLRINNILRRVRTAEVSQEVAAISFGQVEVCANQRSVKVAGKLVILTAKEFDLLLHLIANPAQVFSKSQLLDQIWGYDYIGDYNTINVHVRRLREKIEADPSNPVYIKTVWGVGYKFDDTI